MGGCSREHLPIFYKEGNYMVEGKNYGGYKYRNRRDKSHSGRNSLLGTVFTFITGAVIKDLTSEDSNLKKLFNKVIHPKLVEDKTDKKKVIEADFSVIDNKEIEKK
jgi:hypothetical protein